MALLKKTTDNSDIVKDTWRFELKYRITNLQYQKMKIALLPQMKMDFYTKKAKENRYLVRSLYYDTYDYNLYHQKMDGDSDRIKFRLRTYSKQVEEDTIIRVEMKVRQANAMDKLTELVSFADYKYFLKKKHWPASNSLVLEEFERYLHMKTLMPQVLIDYQREGFEDRAGEGIRVTFDHGVSSAHAKTLFPDRVFFRKHNPGSIVFEIKCRHQRPYWLHNLIREYGLKLVANSKFTQGIQASRQDLYHPDGVVVIR